ncbi:MAG: hypothetical protein EAY75_18005, partial [Bacteroidetes bacterium]
MAPSAELCRLADEFSALLCYVLVKIKTSEHQHIKKSLRFFSFFLDKKRNKKIKGCRNWPKNSGGGLNPG